MENNIAFDNNESPNNTSRTPLSEIMRNGNLILDFHNSCDKSKFLFFLIKGNNTSGLKNKRKNTSLVHEYFIKCSDSASGGELCVCTFSDEKGNRCGKSYRNVGSSTGNLLRHLETHNIYINNNKKVRTQNIQLHPPNIQRQREESMLKWILKTNQPLSAVTNEAYKEKMAEFDPAFVIPGEKKIRAMIGKSFNHNQQTLQDLVHKTSHNISLTADFWSSRAKHGYLGITAVWITPNFEIKDVMLSIEYIPSPHTAEIIANSFYKCILNWNLKDRVTSITIDNGANMVAAIRLLKEEPGCINIQHMPCASHTLQLAIGKGLMLAEVLIARAKRLIRFFGTQKQIERLIKAEEKLGYEECLHPIQDVPTRWNSTYYAWNRLFFLKDAIVQLQTDLYTSTEDNEKKDGKKLKGIMLSDEEWELIDQLVNLLMPFENATREFSGGTYITLSKMIDTIKELIFDLADFSLLSPINSSEDNISEDVIEETIEVDDNEVISNYTKRKISIKNPLNTAGILDMIKANIYSSLIYYWNIPNDSGYLASLLDPRYKNLNCLEVGDEKNRIIHKLYYEYASIKGTSTPLRDSNNSTNANKNTRSYKQYCQNRLDKKKKNSDVLLEENEISKFLAMPVALEVEDPLEWWRKHAQKFPILSQLARKYLAIPATSVASERLFSDAGNLISPYRSRLNPALVAKMLFLKRNMKVMDVFAPDWNDLEDNELE